MAPSSSTLVAAAALALASCLVTPAHAFWRMPCRSRTALARIDPLVDWGVPSKHAHAIHGNGNFDFTCNSTTLAANNPCTSCGVYEDKSVYWTPAMYFEHPDGTTEVVEQVGGMLAYYLLYGENLKAFPEGFSMIAGNTDRRTFPDIDPNKPKSEWAGKDITQNSLQAKALGFNCLNYAVAPEASLARHHLPSKAFMDAHCTDGIRLELMFPSCWDGKQLSATTAHQHVRYPTLVTDGTCPPGYETRIPSLFYETIWNTYAFKGKPGKFIFANGDTTGYGYHGDFLMGWEEELLAAAVKDCTNDSGEVSDCQHFTLQTDADAAKCQLKLPAALDNDNCTGPRKGLCGGDESVEAASQPKPKPTPYKPAVPKPKQKGQPPKKPKHHKNPPPHKPKHNRPVHYTTRKVGHVAPAAVTPPPVLAAAPVPPPAGDNVSKRTYTSDGDVYEVCIVEEDITVTETTYLTYHKRDAKPTPVRRHVHHHHQEIALQQQQS